MSGSNIGMMDPAYFVGRRQILQWMNSAFQMNVAKVEDTASGSVACQILDAVYPGEVPMSKVRWDAKSPHEFIDNYKIIQQVFEKKGIDKHIEVEKLMRAKYQDNLENMQWFKSFYEKNYAGQPYDPISRRSKGKGADAVPAFALDPARRGPAHTEPEGADAAPSARGVAKASGVASGGSGAAAKAAAPAAVSGARATAPAVVRKPAAAATSGPSTASAAVRSPAHGGGAGQLEAAAARISALTSENAELRLSVESLEKERDFYFGKLRDIEILLQTYAGPDKPTADAILQILYATDEDFTTPE